MCLEGRGFLQLERNAENLLHSQFARGNLGYQDHGTLPHQKGADFAISISCCRLANEVFMSPNSTLMNGKRVHFVRAVRDLRPLLRSPGARTGGWAGGSPRERGRIAADG